MKILLAGGCFRLDEHELAARQPPPELNLARGLEQLGHQVECRPLEDLSRMARPSGVDVVHVHHLSKAAVLAVAQRRAPVVFTSHSTRVPPRWIQRQGLELVRRRMAAGVCLSRTELEMTRTAAPATAGRLHVIPNGMSFPDWVAPRQRPEAADDLTLLFVGQLIDVKRVDWAVRALVDAPHYRLRLVFHNDVNRRALEALAAELGVRSRVEFVGQRAGEALYREYRDADLLVLPSRSEAMPSVVVEALSTGLPVVGSDVGAVRELIQGAGVVFSADSRHAFHAALSSAVENYPALASLARERAAEVRATFSVLSMARRHEELYQAVQLGGS